MIENKTPKILLVVNMLGSDSPGYKHIRLYLTQSPWWRRVVNQILWVLWWVFFFFFSPLRVCVWEAAASRSIPGGGGGSKTSRRHLTSFTPLWRNRGCDCTKAQPRARGVKLAGCCFFFFVSSRMWTQCQNSYTAMKHPVNGVDTASVNVAGE